MKAFTLSLFIILSLNSFGQSFEKGIYRGNKLPFEVCYFTYTDSIIEVEYFYEKAGEIFGHIPSKKLVLGMESFATKPAYISSDDSLTVYFKKDHFLIKRLGFGKIKVCNIKSQKSEIRNLRNKNRLFVFSHELHKELKLKPRFDDKAFWEKLHSYGLEKETLLEENEFSEKIVNVREEMKKNWR
ncbi:MAG: hypothetical protein JKX79_12810 [Labilibaculum sp.]|nr:hypothetical protein [Labilibaculum sp.]